MTDEQPTVHNRLGVLRAERGLSRRQLAVGLDINYQTVGFIERGDYLPSLGLALAMGRFFGLPVEAIFSLDPMRPLSLQVYATNGVGGETPPARRVSHPNEEPDAATGH